MEECVPVGVDDLIELNFEGADIREVIQGLAAGLCIHYSIDPRVQGAVTLRTASKIRGQDLFPLFHQILRLNGIAAVKIGDIYHIAPVGEAKTTVPLITEGSQRHTASAQNEFVIELVKVEHIAVSEMAEILQPFVSPGGDVVAYPRGNLVILVDLASNVERLRDLIAAFDTDTFRALHAQTYRIEHANVEDLGKELASILQPYGVTPENMAERGLYIIPLTRLNAIVVFSFSEEVFSQIENGSGFWTCRPKRAAGAPSTCMRSRTPRPPTWPACWAIYTAVAAAGAVAGATGGATRIPTAASGTRRPDAAAGWVGAAHAGVAAAAS